MTVSSIESISFGEFFLYANKHVIPYTLTKRGRYFNMWIGVFCFLAINCVLDDQHLFAALWRSLYVHASSIFCRIRNYSCSNMILKPCGFVVSICFFVTLTLDVYATLVFTREYVSVYLIICLFLLYSTCNKLFYIRNKFIFFPSWISGIFAYINYLEPKTRKEILEFLIKGLQRLEYRGYDSAGLFKSLSIFNRNLNCYSPIFLDCFMVCFWAHCVC